MLVKSPLHAKGRAARLVSAALLSTTMLTGVSFWNVPGASANHPVLVEGNCLKDGPDTTTVEPGTCGDYDGDGRVGTAEDTDGNDQIFGTIGAALGEAMQGANQNGRILIVTSGIFLETVTITAATGNVSLEAAPGVDANIEAVRAGDAANNTVRQNRPGIIVDAPANRYVTIRNIMSRNWTDGIQIRGDSRVTLDNVRVENNRDHGIRAMGNSRVAITHSQVNATGFRQGAGVDNTPNPGEGIDFQDRSSGVVAFTTITGSFSSGIDNSTSESKGVRLLDVVTFDNNPDLEGDFEGDDD